MPVDVMATLRQAVRELEADKGRIEHQLAAMRNVLASLDSAKGRAVRAVRQVAPRRRRRMSAGARRALSQRMKAYWAKRRTAASKDKGTPRQK